MRMSGYLRTWSTEPTASNMDLGGLALHLVDAMLITQKHRAIQAASTSISNCAQ